MLNEEIMSPRMQLPQCPEALNEIGEIKSDIRQIFDLLRAMRDDMAKNSTSVAVQNAELTFMRDTFDKHCVEADNYKNRLTRLEELKHEAKGFIFGMTKGAALLLMGGSAAVTLSVNKLLEIWNGVK